MNQHKLNDEMLEKVIDAAYGSASVWVKLEVWLKRIKDSEAEQIYREYKLTADQVKSIRRPECPDYVLNNPEALREKGDKRNSAKRFRMKPAAAALIILLTAAVVFTIMQYEKTEEVKYTEAEIIKAEAEVKNSLQLVSQIFKRTQDRVEEDIIKRSVAEPLYKGIKTLNNLLIGG